MSAHDRREADVMHPLATLTEGLGGFVSFEQLRRRGVSERAVRSALRHGLRRARRGIYTTRPADDPGVLAVAAGCRTTGLTALRELGCWSRTPTAQHWVAPAHAGRVGVVPPSVQLHWRHTPPIGDGTISRDSVADSLVRVALDEPFEDAVAAFDWALHERAVSSDALNRALLALPGRASAIRHTVDLLCESFPESIARTRLRARGLRVESQLPVARTRRIDLVVEGVIAIEVDGRRYHESEFERDRRKDLAILREGRTVVRASAVMVEHHWSDIEDAVLVALAQHRGLRARRRHDIRRSSASARR
jgi:very-short-patch-repair endonuclease